MVTKKKTNVNLEMSNELKTRLIRYITKTWPEEPYGKQKEVVEKALTEFLDKAEHTGD